MKLSARIVFRPLLDNSSMLSLDVACPMQSGVSMDEDPSDVSDISLFFLVGVGV